MSQRGSRRTSRSSSSSSSSSTSAPPIAETTSTSFVGDADLDNLDISSHIQFMDVERDLLHRDFQKETERVMSLLVPLTRNIKNLEEEDEESSMEIETTKEEVLELFKEAVAQEHSFKRMKDAFSITKMAHTRERFQDIEEAYLAKLADLDHEYESKPENDRLKDHREFSKFKREYFGGDDDEIEVHETRTYKCPLVKTVMTHPMKNTTCGHHYERDAILEYVRRFSDCPVAACGSKVSKATLKDDPGLLKEIRDMERRKKLGKGRENKKRNENVVEV